MLGFIRDFRHYAGMFCIGVLMSGGCYESNSLIQVTGSISVGGKPARGASVRFYPASQTDSLFPAMGTVDEEGRYSLSTRGSAGVAAGKYRVTIVWPDPSVRFTADQIEAGASPNDAPDLLHGEYASPQKTPLEIEITRQTKEVRSIELP
ncbi:MAG: hypothetical protein U0892_08505 [Pirellulales bacterium]